MSYPNRWRRRKIAADVANAQLERLRATWYSAPSATTTQPPAVVGAFCRAYFNTKKEKPMADKHPFEEKYPAEKGWKLSEDPRKCKVTHLVCCGVKEFHGVQGRWQFSDNQAYEVGIEKFTAAQSCAVLHRMYSEIQHHRPFWLFTDNDGRTNEGGKLADYLEARDLGAVIRTPRLMNDNSGLRVMMYIFMPNKSFKNFKPEA